MTAAESHGAGTRLDTCTLSVALIQTTVPRYRRSFIAMLDERLGGRLCVLAGNEYFDPTIRMDARGASTTVVRNRYLCRRNLLWQRGTVIAAAHYDVVVAELNPRILSNWAILVLRRALRRPTVLWGHAWPRRGASARSDKLRQLMRRLASAVLVYTQTEARDLRRVMPGSLVEAAPNALYPVATYSDSDQADRQRPSNIVFVGRLVDAKKPRLLLQAFLSALNDLPSDIRLVFVGDGPLRRDLQSHAAGSLDRVLFKGALADISELQPIYASAVTSVSPGSAGLSLIQSLWFGVPSIVARQDVHGPEIEAVVEGVNAVFFHSDSVEALRDALVAVVRDRETWRRRRGEIARECAARYSVDEMVEAFLRVVSAVSK